MPALDRRLVRAHRAVRAHLALVVALSLAAAVLIIAQATLLAGVIDRAAFGHASLRALVPALGGLAAVITGRALVAGAFELSGRAGAVATMRDVREHVVRRLLVERPGRVARERTGALAADAVQGVDALEDYFAGYLPQLVLAVVVPVAVLGWMATLDPVVAGLLAVTVPLLVAFMVLIGLRARVRTEARRGALAVLSAHFLDVVRGLATLRAHNRDSVQPERIAAIGEAYRRETMATLRVAFLSALVLELCAMLGTALAAAAVGVALAGGHLGFRAGLTVLLLAPELYAPLRAVGQQFHAGAEGTAAARRLFEVLDEPGAVVAEGTAPAPDPTRAPVRLEGVGFAHPDRAGDVLAGLDLELAPGELTAVVGRSGAGKSTLAGLVLRLADPTEGRVTCGGTDLREVDLDAWRSRLGWVPQSTRLFAGTVADNIRLGAPQASDAEVREAARAAGALAFVDALPQGFATPVGDGGRRLSAGQGRRLALARALVRDAPLLVLDEPTAHLDEVTAAEVGEAIVRRSAGRTTLLLTHDLALAARADRVVELRAGRLGELSVGVA